MNRIAYLITLLSMTGTLANSFGKRWCFYVWLGTNGFWCVYNASCEQYAQALLYAFNLVTCIVGLWKWKREKTGGKEMFKKRRGIRLSYNEQGLIYFACMNLMHQPPRLREAVRELCECIGGEDSEALYEFLTNDAVSARAVCMKYFVDEKKLYTMRKRFYEEFYKKLRAEEKASKEKGEVIPRPDSA